MRQVALAGYLLLFLSQGITTLVLDDSGEGIREAADVGVDNVLCETGNGAEESSELGYFIAGLGK